MIEINKLYCMDNLELLKQIKENSIDLCYIDPPFSTGKVFKTKEGEVAYEDKYNLNELLEMLEPRIKEIHRVLKSTGSFYIHGDYRFIPYVRIMCDKIFGINNLRNEIYWYYSNKMSRSSKDFPKNTDTILFYTKSKDNIFNEQKEIRDKPIQISKRVWKDKKNMRARDENENIIYEMSYDRTIDNVWKIPIIGSTSKERIGYPTQKPKLLLERILKASLFYDKEPNTYSGVVLDCFAGSGTTLEVAKELGADYIGCDNSEVAIKYINERLNK